jgi:hypothetical protein
MQVRQSPTVTHTLRWVTDVDARAGVSTEAVRAARVQGRIAAPVPRLSL